MNNIQRENVWREYVFIGLVIALCVFVLDPIPSGRTVRLHGELRMQYVLEATMAYVAERDSFVAERDSFPSALTDLKGTHLSKLKFNGDVFLPELVIDDQKTLTYLPRAMALAGQFESNEIVVAYDTTPCSDGFWYVGFVDGHVERMSSKKVQSMVLEQHKMLQGNRVKKVEVK